MPSNTSPDRHKTLQGLYGLRALLAQHEQSVIGVGRKSRRGGAQLPSLQHLSQEPCSWAPLEPRVGELIPVVAEASVAARVGGAAAAIRHAGARGVKHLAERIRLLEPRDQASASGNGVIEHDLMGI